MDRLWKLLDLSGADGVTPQIAAAFALMMVDDYNVTPALFLEIRGSAQQAAREELFDKLEGFEDVAAPVMIELMLDEVYSHPPQRAALLAGYLYAKMVADGFVDSAAAFKAAVCDDFRAARAARA
jgi:hypothetical protein